MQRGFVIERGLLNMGYKNIRKILEASEIVELMPLPEHLKKIKEKRDEEIRKVFDGTSDKFIVIIGPCSADNEDAVCDYVSRLGKIQEKVKDKLILIPRIYTNKPRTTGEGYKGMLHQPDLDKEPNVSDGILAIRKMHIRAIEESGLTAADEMLYPDNLAYMEDLLSYHAVGARSVENQQHRLTSSCLDLPVGMKNPTSGDLSVMFNAIKAAQSGHNFIYRSNEVETTGNPYAHAILRGYVNRHGENMPNYHYEDLELVLDFYEKRGLQNPALIVDTNHSNSRKRYFEQTRIAKEILYSRKYNIKLKKLIKGLLIESYLVQGCQEISEHMEYGKSITDPCLGWEESEELIYYIAENV